MHSDEGAEAPWSRGGEAAEPEPEWAQEIRNRRKARGSRLREIFDAFADTAPHDEEANER